MQPFSSVTAIGVPIDIPNCDTDQIIPARFLRRAKDDPKYATFLLHDLRFNSDGSETDFIYNRAPYCDSHIVVADINWGCGSSRETAVNALVANQIRAVVAPSFGDIHYNNCIRNGVLPVRLPATSCDQLRKQLHSAPGARMTIDLETQSVTGPDQTLYPFTIDVFDRMRLLEGLDDITLTQQHEKTIALFEENYRDQNAWVFDA